MGDPVIGAWLSFLDAGIRSHPESLVPFEANELAALELLVAGVSVSDEESLPDDVTF